MTGTIEPWDLWWALVRFEDTDEIKRRPVVVLENGEAMALVMKVTSHEPRQQWGKYDIVYWKSAGLPKPSTIRMTQLIRLEHGMFDRRIGRLHPVDIENLLKRMCQ